MRSARALAMVVGVAAGLAACTAAEPETPSSEPSSSTTTAPAGSYQEVRFAAADGEQRTGRLFGDSASVSDSDGEVAVVLSYMGRSGDSQDDWLAFAELLAERGYLALTYERRPAALSKNWVDVLGAVDYLKGNGARKVIAAGASLGAMASLQAVQEQGDNVNALIWLAGVLDNSGYQFKQDDVAEVACPMLIASGAEDTYGAADAARTLYGWARDPAELVMVPSDRHGTDILEDGGASARELEQALLAFVDEIAEEPAVTC